MVSGRRVYLETDEPPVFGKERSISGRARQKRAFFVLMTCIIQSRPSMGARINDVNLESLIREGRENDAFRLPRSNKPFTDLLRQITTFCEESGNDVFCFPQSKKPLMDFLRPYQITL